MKMYASIGHTMRSGIAVLDERLIFALFLLLKIVFLRQYILMMLYPSLRCLSPHSIPYHIHTHSVSP